ncbi:MAG TPA: ABC-2 transporter permease [Firmicutes bacterium]|jgi:ABC-2 type transport system permease protein|nr:ABC-2 transporter permease [Bacillota bacterium]HHT42299.1 ABC-2 transporter permease [Bacillota bacterium]
MITLVLKDLLLQKKILTTMFIYVFIFSFAFRSLGEYQPVAIITGVSYMLVMFAGAWEDKNNADRLWNSLPVSKWQIVGSKYLSVLAYVALASAATWITMTVLSLVNVSVAMGAVSLVSIAAGAVSVLLLSSFYLPIYFALGYIKSRYLNFVIYFAFLFLANALSGLVGRLSAVPFLANAGSAVLLGLGVGSMALVIAVSFVLSLRLYTRREF